MDVSTVLPSGSFGARAMLLGERIDLRSRFAAEALARNPLTVPVKGGGVAVLFRYGAVVLFDVPEAVQAPFLDQVLALVWNRYEKPETEDVAVCIDPAILEGVQGGTVYFTSMSVERMQIVASVLSKSLVLAMYESRVAQNFDRVEPLARNLERNGRIGGRTSDLLKHIGAMLLSEQMMVGSVEISEKPDTLWDHPDLEGLYLRMESEFEIRERYAVLERKLNLISRTVQTVVELLHSKRSLRLEWAIVLLIVFEVMLTLYTMYTGGN
ncbi:MAG: RMD1 family protein [Burkholderiales bacterium]|nr:RMD1 family protein [Burkholderiales bacterium]